MSPLLHSLRLPLGLTREHCQLKYSNCREIWMWPWGSCSQPGPPWMPSAEGWYQTLKLPLRLSALMWSGMLRLHIQLPSGRQRLPVQIIPIPWNSPLKRVCKTWNMNPFRRHAEQLYKPVLWKVGGTYVSLTVADRECALSHPFGYYNSTDCSNGKTHPHNSPSNCDVDTCISHRDQTMMPLVQPGGSLSLFRGGRGCSVRNDPRGVAPLKVERQKISRKTPERKLLGGLFKGHGDHQGSHAGLSSLPQGNVCLGRVLWPDIDFQRNGQRDKSPECKDPQSTEGLGQWVGTKGHQLCHKSLPMGDTIFSHSITNWVTKHKWIKGDSLPWDSVPARQLLILPLVC